MTKEELNRQLMDLFTHEVQERAAEFERLLLAMEESSDLQERRASIEKLLRIVHSLKGAAGLVEVRPIEAICHRMEDLLSLFTRNGRSIEQPDLEVLLAAADAIAEAGRELGQRGSAPGDGIKDALKQLGARLQPTSKKRHEKLVKHGPVRETMALPPIRASDRDGSIRISGDRIDLLLYRSGELLAAKSRVALRAAQAASLRERARRLHTPRRATADDTEPLEDGLRELASCLAEDARLIGSLVSALDHEIRRARLQRFAEACQGLPRMARDIGIASGKEAELRVIGGDIEIDRSIVAGLQDTMRHLVRNSMSHGIETPEERRAAGKPGKGRITISAALFGDRFQVHVEDDGRGFGIDSIAEAANRMGFAEPPDERLRLRQAFEPGLSTSAELTSLSGRGIGLDIVRNAVETMRGTVELSTSHGGGATFVMTLPLTLATVRALEVTAGGQIFAIDLASIRSVGRVSAGDLPAPGKARILRTDGREARLLDLGSWFGFPVRSASDASDTCHIVFVGPAGGETAVLVEQILGEQELLVRPLGPRLADLRSYSGATILPDGRVALLLNAAALVEAAVSEETLETHAYSIEHRPLRRRVLVVDDSPSVRALQGLILEAAGYEVVLAADGSEAWEHLRAHGADVVVADIDMPEMDGLTLTRAIRKSRKFAQLPVILITGRDTLEEKEQGLHAGANAYIAKSGFDQQLFLEAVRQVM